MLTRERIAQARADFDRLTEGIPLTGRTFLDIGFGQGLSLLIAQEHGAAVVGCDLNEKCAEVLTVTRRRFCTSGTELPEPPVVTGSILDAATVDTLKGYGSPEGTFDIVHSWGVLHHTGAMQQAIANAASLVNDGGYLITALYNRHWSSPVWKLIKRWYCLLPVFARTALVWLLYPVILIAKAIVTRKNPFVMDRGMDFFHNVVDWVGGYPYEYISVDEFRAIMESYRFDCIRVVTARVPTGCNEFVFRRKPAVTSGAREKPS